MLQEEYNVVIFIKKFFQYKYFGVVMLQIAYILLLKIGKNTIALLQSTFKSS